MIRNINKEQLKKDFKAKYLQLNGAKYTEGSDYSKYEALGYLIVDYLSEIWHKIVNKYKENNSKQEAIRYNESVESVSKVLYPDDSSQEGKILRLKQMKLL